MMVALFALAGTSAWAAGGAVGGMAGPSTSGNAATNTAATAAATGASSNGLSQAPQSTNMNPLPPPPPTSTNPLAASNNTIPPTPAPATAGLPSPPQTGALPSQQGLSSRDANESRPSPSLDATQVTSVQASLAAGGLYRGPIDGNMSASLRAAIRQYQALAAIPQTGDLDAETMARLQRSALSGSVGSNGATSTTGNRNAAGDPFTSAPPAGVAATGSGSTGTATFSTPFPLSAPINTSPSTGQTATIQP